MTESDNRPSGGGSLLALTVQVVTWVGLLGVSWLQMMVLHETGHMLAAWSVGGQVQEVVLHPLSLSRTEIRPNPHPRFVAWGGIVGGCLLPLLVWWTLTRLARSLGFLGRFFAGFCLIVNGAYLAGGAMGGIGDARVLLQQGDSVFLLIGVGLGLAATGLALWHGQARHFRREQLQTRPRLAIGLLIVFLTSALIQTWFG